MSRIHSRVPLCANRAKLSFRNSLAKTKHKSLSYIKLNERRLKSLHLYIKDLLKRNRDLGSSNQPLFYKLEQQYVPVRTQKTETNLDNVLPAFRVPRKQTPEEDYIYPKRMKHVNIVNPEYLVRGISISTIAALSAYIVLKAMT